jgi:hypothetical protein
MPREDSSGNLAPLPDDLAPELRDLAIFLRKRFDLLRTSVRAYAHRNNWDPGAVSRFLSGDRIPPQDFADTLLADAGPQRSPEEVEAERAHVFDLRIKALQVRNARAARSEEITRELANAEREISLLRTTERALASTLSKTEAEYKSLHAQYQEMQKRLRDAPPQITSGPELKQLAHDRDRTQEEIDRLKGELALEKAARIAAEERRDALQAELDKAEVELVRAGGSAFAVGTYDLQHQLLVALRSRRTRWGGLIGLVAVPAVTYGAPIYLGLVYHTLTSSQGFLKVITACGLSIPLWIALAVRRVERTEADRRIRQVAWLFAITAATFFTAALI